MLLFLELAWDYFLWDIFGQYFYYNVSSLHRVYNIYQYWLLHQVPLNPLQKLLKPMVDQTP